jgi:hypothetical protein
MRKYSPKIQMFEGSKRFQLYKKLSNGELMHITSTEALNLSHAIGIFQEQKRVIDFHKEYKVTGI